MSGSHAKERFIKTFVKLYFDEKDIQFKHVIIDGISNMDTEISIPILEEILNKDDGSSGDVLITMISRYAEQLKDLEQSDY